MVRYHAAIQNPIPELTTRSKVRNLSRLTRSSQSAKSLSPENSTRIGSSLNPSWLTTAAKLRVGILRHSLELRRFHDPLHSRWLHDRAYPTDRLELPRKISIFGKVRQIFPDFAVRIRGQRKRTAGLLGDSPAARSVKNRVRQGPLEAPSSPCRTHVLFGVTP